MQTDQSSLKEKARTVDQTSAPTSSASDQSTCPISEAWGWAANNLGKPLVNAALVEPGNALAGTLGLGHFQMLDVKPAEFMTASWMAQSIAGALGSIFPYVAAGELAGGGMRWAGETLGLDAENLFTGPLGSPKLARIMGAGIYDGLRQPEDDADTLRNRVAHGLGGMAAFTVFEFSGQKGWSGRATSGFLGAEAQQMVSHAISHGNNPADYQAFLKAGLGGAALNMALPMVHDAFGHAIDGLNSKTGRGIPIQRYIDTRLGTTVLDQSSSLKAAVKANPWTRVLEGSDNSALLDSNKVTLEPGAQADKLGHELDHLQSSRAGKYEGDFVKAAQLLASDENRAWDVFRQARLSQELDSRSLESNIARELGLTQTQASLPQPLPDLGELAAHARATYDTVWRWEFGVFKTSAGTFRPDIEYGGTAKTASAIAAEKEGAIQVVKHLQESGHQAVFTGGYVRDELLGRTSKDIDIATSATPDQVQAVFNSLDVPVMPRGKSFGVMAVRLGGNDYEVATFRNDGQYSDGRHPDSVRFGTMQEDAERRDLTMNAIFKDPISGRIYDLVGGKKDIEAGIIRAVGDPKERIAEDKLRMMRVPRFAAQVGFRVDSELIAAMKAHSPDIQAISADRIRDEIAKMMVAADPVRGLQLMMNTGLMREVLPEVYRLRGPKGRQDPIWHPEKTVWTHTKLVVDQLKGSSLERMLGGLFHDVGKPDTQEIYETGRISNHGHDKVGADLMPEIGKRLRWPNKLIDSVSDLVRLHMKMHKVEEMSGNKLRGLLERPDIMDLIELQHADSQGNWYPERLSNSHRQFLLQQLEKLRQAAPSQQLGAKPIITGDLLNELDFRPGPAYRGILKSAMQAQQQGVFDSPEGGRNWLLENFSEVRGLTFKDQWDLEQLAKQAADSEE